MTLSLDVKEGLAQLARLLDDPVLEPNPDRVDWSSARTALDHVQTALDTQVLSKLASAAPLAAGSDVQTAAADVTAHVGAILHIAGNTPAARALFERAVSLATSMQQKAGFAAALREPSSFAMIVHAHWLEARGKLGAAAARREQVRQDAAEPALRQAAAESLGADPHEPLPTGTPVRSAPPLFRINGFGVGLYGSRDERPDGTEVSTLCISALWIPVLPLTAYRVVREGDRVGFISREPLSGFARGFRTLALSALVIAIGWGAVSKYYGSPERKAKQAIAAAAKLEKSGPAEAAAAAWDHVLEEWDGKVDSDTLAPAAEGVVRVAIAGVHQPFGPADLDAERRVVARYEQLSEPLRDAARPRLEAALVAWADQLGAADGEHARAGLRVLDEAARIDPDADLNTRRVVLRRGLAASLAAEEPIGALRLYLQNGGDHASLEAAVALLGPVVASPSLILDLDDLLDSWLGYAEKDDVSREIAGKLRPALTAARLRKTDPKRQALLDDPGEVALRDALAAAPSDQELTVAFAQLVAARGDLAGATKMLEAFGKPGALVGGARVMLASLRREAGDLAGAEAMLAGWLDWRLAPFQESAQRYLSAERDLRERLAADLKAGRYDGELMPKVQGLSEDARDRFVGEWFQGRVDDDQSLATLRAVWLRHSDVVPASLLLGQVKLERARTASGAERDALLAGAEQAYLGVQSVAGGAPSYHLGLGQVYYRLGRVADGEKEFAAVRAEATPEILLELAKKYRELGMDDRARESAEKVATDEAAGTGTRDSAAVLRALLAVDEDDQEKWLRQSHNEQAGLELLQLEAVRLRREGKDDEADAKYAKVFAAWAKDADHDGVSANNAASALHGRFECTGKLAFIDQAVKLSEKSVRLQAENALAVGNAAQVQIYRARLRVLDRWVQVNVLRPSHTQAEALLSALEAGPLGDQVRAALGQDPAFRRGLELLRRQQTLSPQEPGAYMDELDMLAEIRDEAAMRALVARVAPLAGFESAERVLQRKRWVAGEHDETMAKLSHSQIDELDRVLALPVDAMTPRTRAAALVLLGAAWLQLSLIEHDAEVLARAEDVVRRAHALGPELATPTLIGWGMVTRAFDKAAAADEELSRAWRTAQRRFPAWFAAWHLATSEQGAKFLAALRAQPGFAEAVRQISLENPGPSDFALGWLLGDEARQKAAAPAFDNERTRLRYELRTHLYPDDTDLALEASYFATRGKPTPAAAAR